VVPRRQRHRDDGPAIKNADGSGSWHRDGKLHRDDRPTIEDADGYRAWWLDGVRVEAGDLLALAPLRPRSRITTLAETS
jgi:hypothetical protein